MSIVHDYEAIAARVKDPSGREERGPPECTRCGDSGYEMYGTGHHDPHFRTCPWCFNPKRHPCP